MAKKFKVKVAKSLTNEQKASLEKDKQLVRDMIYNTITSRSELLSTLTDPRRDIDKECGYPNRISIQQYKKMYDREGLATRVVELMPQESWGVDPEISEDENSDNDTTFEKEWKDLENEHNLYSYMERIDELSGIGAFGILLFGLDDGKKLNEPVDGIDEQGNRTGSAQHEILYVRPFDQSLVTIKTSETNTSNKRFGQPTMYSVTMQNPNVDQNATVIEDEGKEVLIHWHRVIHIADLRKSSEVYGTPRLQSLFNRLLDIQKITGGSAEMFWKGGFPGYSFELDPNAQAPDDDAMTELKTQIAQWSNGLQRYLTTQGIKVNSLDPQVADPENHVDVQLTICAIALGVPKRVFMGSEQAKLASETDSQNWNKRIKRRQNKYLTPYVVKPVINRCIAYGALPEVEKYEVLWPDLNTPSEKDKAEVAKAWIETFKAYVGGDVDTLIPPELFLKMYAELNDDEVDKVMKALAKHIQELEDENEELMQTEEEDTEQTDEENMDEETE